MGFWDKMRDVAESVPVVGNAALAVVDIARAKMGADEGQSVKDILVKDYAINESRNALASAANAPVVRPTLAGLAKVYSYGVARPVSTGLQVESDAMTGQGTIFGSKEWRDAWDQSRTLSPGQALVGTVAREIPGAPAALGIKDASWAQIAQTGEKDSGRFNTKFSLASGTLDALGSWFADPLVIAGKATKVAKLRHAELRPGDVQGIAAKDAAGLTRRQTKVRSEVDSFVKETDGYSASELMRFKAFKNNAALATAFDAADGNHALKRLVLRTAMGDPEAKLQLSQQAAHISARLDRMTNQIDDVLFADELAAPGSLFEFHNGATDLAALQHEKKSDERLLDFYQRILPDEDAALQAEQLGVPLDSHNLGAFGSFGERPRVTTGDRKALAHERSYVIQDGVGDIPVRVKYQAVGRRPEGMVQLHDAEQTFEEMSNMLRRVRGLSSESRRKMLDGLVAAPDDNARMLSIQAIEENVFHHIGDQLGYSHDEITSLLAKTLDERGRMIKHVKERAFSGATDQRGVPVDMVILEDGTAFHRPLLETHLANQTPTLDVDHIYRVLKNNAERVGALRAGAGKSFDVVKDAGMLVNDLWKFQTLLRLGYLQRNIIDNQMRLFGYLGGMDHVRTMAENIGQGIMHKLSSISAAAARQDAVVRVGELNKQIEESLAGRPIKYHPLDEDPKLQALVDERDRWQTVVDNGPNPDDFSRHFGQGEVQVGPYTRPDAFGKRTSEYERYRNQVSGEDMWANFAGGEMERLLNKMRSDEWVTITGSDSRYTDHYLRVVNQ